MQTHITTTPFGRRPLSLAQVASQARTRARPVDKAVHKWNLFREVCAAKLRLGVSERALAVLDALLSFHPETVLIGEQLIVFPSNQQLALRAHGMAPATLRRHLFALVECGLILRRDSPNGKRYARKGQGGEIETAFGFDLAPLVARADEIAALAEAVRAEQRAVRLVREKITLCRRDIGKMIVAAMEAELVPCGLPRGLEDWSAVHLYFRSLVAAIPRNGSVDDLEQVATELEALAAAMLKLLETQHENNKSIANESHIERHIQNSKPELSIDLEPDFEQVRGQDSASSPTDDLPHPRAEAEQNIETKQGGSLYRLGMVLSACPDLLDYARGNIANWRDFVAASRMIRPMLGISPSALEAAETAMGETNAAITLAAILQKGAEITSPGGYLRGLTMRAQSGQFSPGPMLMALIAARKRERKLA